MTVGCLCGKESDINVYKYCPKCGRQLSMSNKPKLKKEGFIRDKEPFFNYNF